MSFLCALLLVYTVCTLPCFYKLNDDNDDNDELMILHVSLVVLAS